MVTPRLHCISATAAPWTLTFSALSRSTRPRSPPLSPSWPPRRSLSANTLSGIVHRGGAVKVSFFGGPGVSRLAPPHIAPDNGLQVATLLDLAGTKASVVQQRAEAKDYTDIDAILRDGRIDLPTALASALAIYGPQFNPQITLKALSSFSDGNLRRLPKATKDRLAQAAREVDLDRLPTIARAPQPRERNGGPSQ
jgi:hypothetical protein